MKWLSRWLARNTLSAEVPDNDNQLSDLMARGRRAFYDEQFEQAAALFEKAWLVAEQSQDSTAQADVKLHQADVLIARQEYAAARDLLLELETRSRSARHRAPLAYALVSLGLIAEADGHADEARQRYEEAIRIAEEANAKGAAGRARAHLGEDYLRRGNATYAVRLLRAALLELEQSGDTELVSHFMCRLAEALAESGETQPSLELMRRALERAEALRHRTFIRQISTALAQRLLSAGELAQARDLFRQTLTASDTQSPDPHETLSATLGLAQAQALLGNPEAVSLATESEKLALALHKPAEAARACAIQAELQMHSQNHEEALKSWDRALTYAAELTEPEALVFRLRHAQTLGAMRRIDEAITAIRTIMEQARSSENPVIEIDAGIHLAQLHEENQDWQAALNQRLQTVRLCEVHHASEKAALLHCDIAGLRGWMGQSTRSAQDIRQALTLLPQVKEPVQRQRVLLFAGRSLSQQGDQHSAESFFQEGMALAEQTKRADLKAFAQAVQGAVFAPTHRAIEGLHLLQDARRYYTEQGDTLAQASVAVDLAQGLYTTGQSSQARQHLETALPVLEANHDTRSVLRARLLLARIMLSSGALDAAEALLRQVLTSLEGSPFLAPRIHAQLGLIEVTLERGQIERAELELQNTTGSAERSGNRMLQAQCAVLQSRLASMQGHPDAAAQHWKEALRLHDMLRLPLPQADWLVSPASANAQDS